VQFGGCSNKKNTRANMLPRIWNLGTKTQKNFGKLLKF
jgi:hypothetical protein